MPTMTALETAQRQVRYLCRLGDELTGRGVTAKIVEPRGGPPRLHVLNPDLHAGAYEFAEDIGAEFGADGWWFTWSWGEKCCSAEDPVGAANKIIWVLRT